ncbi:response regulator [Leptolyngbyaceae cyanobacterium CCMR0082]|uniref:Response regulator n=2 Tax=Adonisia turfae TaxID=2950184 RepID=A0A6M0S1J1_9CYAN|nr:response regulator [Adonisia turfae]MDV3352949.1 response regulator [Leptothoe sp. LEGE 181152]NEZ57280.1 response regulator [Adonisia turfae CCMR0081]NEZ62347.1 response regulator [Adonisia turfae CCMR0082]
MNSRSIVGYGATQKLHPLSFLAQLISRQVSGHFKLYSGTNSWSLFLNQGKLNFATDTDAPFDRLDRHLQDLSSEISTLVGAVRVQLRLMFEQSPKQAPLTPDYQAISWLVEQSHLTPEQASGLIRAMAIEVIESFLGVQEGSYDLLGLEDIGEYPVLCQLDLRPIVEICQRNRRQSLLSSPSAVAAGAPVVSVQSVAASVPSVSPAANKLVDSESTAQAGAAVVNPQARDGGANMSASSDARRAVYTIACIDDSPTVLNAIQEFLNDRSLNVVPISDPVKALMQVMRCRPDLILLDVTMPNLDGYELCSLLRRHPSFRNTPIVMVTGNTGFIDRAKAKLVRSSGYLTKPFSQSELLKMVFMHLPAVGPRQ